MVGIELRPKTQPQKGQNNERYDTLSNRELPVSTAAQAGELSRPFCTTRGCSNTMVNASLSMKDITHAQRYAHADLKFGL